MKISKVDHRKAAVGRVQKDGMRGIIYKDPSQGKETENLECLVNNRNSKSEGLYSVLNSNAIIFKDKDNKNKDDKDSKDENNKKKQDTVRKIINNFSSIFKGSSNKNQKGNQQLYDGTIQLDDYHAVSSYIKKNIKKKIKINFLEYESNEKLAQDIVATALRNSLRKKITWNKKGYYLPDIATKLLLATIINANIKEYEKIPQEEVLAFVNYVNIDKTKGKSRIKGDKEITSKEDVITSIKKQDVKVQVFDKDGEKMLMLSNSNHPRKKYIADFIKSFAGCANEDEQNKMIFNIRRLIVLYVYGPLQYDKIEMDNPWGKMADFDEKNSIFGYIIQKNAEKDFIYREVISEDLFNNDDNKKKNNSARHLDFDKKIRDVLISHYKAAEETILSDITIIDKNASLFWIQHFEENVEKFVKIRKKRQKDNYICERICNMLWEEWFSYIAMKYIDLGKAVYYFSTPDLYNTSPDKPIKIGPVLKQYKNGLTSFDYEKIKAEETLVRNFATAATFAGSTFSNAVVSEEYRKGYDILEDGRKVDHADVLGYSYKTFKNKEATKANAVQCVLRYFSGVSLWDNNKEENNDKTKVEFLTEIKEHIASVRNTNFHFSTDRRIKATKKNTYVQKLFNSEYSRVKQLIGEKYISNNTVVFYSADNNGKGLYALIKKLYSDKNEREAQIPAFNNIIEKKDLRIFVEDFLLKENIDARKFIFDDIKLSDRYLSSLYFLLKEIYYYGFLSEKDIIKKFDGALKQIEYDVDKENGIQKEERRKKNPKDKRIKDTKQKQAMNNFRKRYDEIKKANNKITFGQLCQQIMTDYNMQNQRQKEILSTDKEKQNAKNGNKPIYEHYVLILQQCIRKMFENYLDNNEVFLFLKYPKISRNGFDTDILSQEKTDKFINDMPEVKMFNGLSVLGEKTSNNTEQDIQLMYDWYITAHFISAKQINMLIGDIRSYKQYVNNIYERAKNTGNIDAANRIINDSQIHRYLDVLAVLEFAIQFTGKTSKEITTYFETDEDYAKYILNYVDFDKYLSNDAPDKYKNALQAFCGQMMKDTKSNDKALGIYYDAKHPIPNKNIIYSLLYGDTHMLSAFMKENTFRINEDEISEYYNCRNKLEKVFKKGTCVSDKEQKSLKEFQNIKNRIELLDIKEYTELINDIMSQMVSWAYLRERDLMYFQLGYHYTKLFYTDQIIETRYNVLKSNIKNYKINIEKGALLYQIIALYNHELPVYKTDKAGNATEAVSGTTGVCIGPFVKNYCKETFDNPSTYYGGISFFEDKNRHDYFAELRNYIAHMKYYALHDKSIWDLFGEMYNGFLIHDIKLKKSVSYIACNILERYFVVAETEMTHSGKNHKRFTFTAKKLTSDKFTYKYKDKKNKDKEKKVYVECRSEKFLEQLKKLLEYKILPSVNE